LFSDLKHADKHDVSIVCSGTNNAQFSTSSRTQQPALPEFTGQSLSVWTQQFFTSWLAAQIQIFISRDCGEALCSCQPSNQNHIVDKISISWLSSEKFPHSKVSHLYYSLLCYKHGKSLS